MKCPDWAKMRNTSAFVIGNASLARDCTLFKRPHMLVYDNRFIPFIFLVYFCLSLKFGIYETAKN